MEFIAELGSNPRALNWATLPYLRAAKESGATAVKIQLFRSEHFPEAERAGFAPALRFAFALVFTRQSPGSRAGSNPPRLS